MKKHHILIVFWHLGLGGIERRIVDLTRLVAQKRYENITITLLLCDKPSHRLDAFVNKQTTTIAYSPYSKNKVLHLVFFFSAIVFWTVRLRPDTLLTFLDIPSIFSVFTGRLIFWRSIRVVLSEETFPSRNTPSPRLRFLVSRMYPLADRILVQTAAVRDDLFGNFGIPLPKIAVVPAWVPGTLRTVMTHPCPSDVLYAGRFTYQKDIFFLLEAAKAMRVSKCPFRLLLIGDGEDKPAIQAYIDKHMLHDYIYIHKSVYDVRQYVLKSKIVVLTSRYEGMPLLLLEAMKARKPTVVRKFKGVEEYTRDGKTSHLIDTPQQCAHRILSLLADPAVRQTMGNYSYHFVQKNYGKKRMAEFLEHVVGNKLKDTV